MAIDLQAARQRLMRRMRRFAHSRGRGIDQHIEDMVQNAFVALYGLPAWERGETDEWVDEFLFKHASVSADVARARGKEFHILNATIARVGGPNRQTSEEAAASLTWENGASRPQQEQYTEACQVRRVLSKLPNVESNLVTLLTEGASPIECAQETGLSLRDVLQRHKALATLVNRLLDDAKDERAEQYRDAL